MRHQAAGFNRDHTPARTAQRMLSFLKRLQGQGQGDGERSRRWLARPSQAGPREDPQAPRHGRHGALRPGRALDEAFYEELETVLLTADVGVGATAALIGGNACARAARRLYRRERSCAKRCAARSSRCCEPLAAPLDGGRAPAVRDHARRRERQPARRLPSASSRITTRARARRCCSPPATPSAPPRASSSSHGASATTSR